jgi:hypothetical protein
MLMEPLKQMKRQVLKKILFSAMVILFSGTLNAQFKNIVLASQEEGKYPPVEPSIVVNPDNPKNIVAGIVLDRSVYTIDGGLTWKETTLKSSYGVYGDPALVADHKGSIYYFHLADPSGKGRSADEWLDRISCQKSTDKGATWGPASFTGLNPPKDNDKPWPAHHPKKDFLAVTWTQFDTYGSKDTTCRTNIMFSKSTSKGDKWSDPVRVNKKSGDCLDSDFTVMGASPAISFDDKIFVVWAHQGNIFLDRSYDDGKNWLKNDMLIAKQMGGWDLAVPGLARCNGLPQLAIDNSGSPFNGSLYVLWADQRSGENDTDIWLIRSSNRGDNWSSPVKVNQDGPGKHQFLPWMTVDQTNGILYVVYYDRRNYVDDQTDVYLAWSMDGGNKFSEVKISESAFTPDASKFLGDYTNVSAHKNIIAPVWTRMDFGKTKVLTTVIKQEDLVKK